MIVDELITSTGPVTGVTEEDHEISDRRTRIAEMCDGICKVLTHNPGCITDFSSNDQDKRIDLSRVFERHKGL